MSTAGIVEDPQGFQVSTGAGSAPVVASNGTDYVAAFLGSNPQALLTVPISSSGTLGATNTLVSSNTLSGKTSLVFAGGEYLAMWNTWSGSAPTSYASLLTTAGAPGGPGVISVCSGASCGNALAAEVGSGFYSLWFAEQVAEGGANATYDIVGAAISASGTVTPPDGELVTDTTPTSSDVGPLLAMRSATQGLVVYNTLQAGLNSSVYRMHARLLSFDAASKDAGDGGSEAGVDATVGDATAGDATIDDATVGGDGAESGASEASAGGPPDGAEAASEDDARGEGTTSGGGSGSGGCSVGSSGDAPSPAFPLIAIVASVAALARGSRSRERGRRG